MKQGKEILTYDSHAHHGDAVIVELVLEQGEIVIENNILSLHQLELVEGLVRGLGAHLLVHGALVCGRECPVERLELLLHGLFRSGRAQRLGLNLWVNFLHPTVFHAIPERRPLPAAVCRWPLAPGRPWA